ncbi:DUF948 domain-containing protein [Sporosarcina sp. Marseille-Q4943]|uniref:DUF948 domain-containing protein n=1 Tax=Sporosarcina sp. Marseille-Q4943 TaxID=2942204 RepID=UPI00208DC19E|nr:DUF948 domain-containing protein [Sporosarcina sp. Marseille-Q4943]
MDWLGIGVLIIGIALAFLTLLLIKPLRKLTDTLDGVRQTTDRLPQLVDDLSKQTTEVMQLSNETIANVNNQVKEVSPLFHIIGDTGEATRKLTLAALKKTNEIKTNTSHASDFTKRENYEGIYGILSFIFFLSQRSGTRK